jgi:hypothetical protein
MKTVNIVDKLSELNFELDDLVLGDFDVIGEWCAKKQRGRDSDLYKKAGAFFRPNYERGLLIYSLILEHDIKSFLEIGFGRGYVTLCAAMAMHENGGGTITTIDPNFDQNHIERLKQAFSKEWFDMIIFASDYSQNYLKNNKDNFDFIYIDGDHRYEAVKQDWELCKDRYNKFLLFDDYIPPKDDAPDDIQCSTLIDSIEDDSKELIIMDRRIFFDDRRIEDDDINYGQVLLTK